MDKVKAEQDFRQITSRLGGLLANTEGMIRDIKELEELKLEIIDDPVRKADVIEHCNLSSKWPLAEITGLFGRLVKLKAYLVNNGFEG